MSALVFGLFGLIIGSFLNVLILRWGTRGLGGRSSCPHCARTLAWYDMVPVFSWLALRGRCRTCGAAISAQYPIVEAATGALFAIIGASPLPLLAALLSCAIVSILIAITVYDLYHTIIPDPWAYAFAALALLTQVILTPSSEITYWIVAAGFIAAAPLFLLWFVSQGRWMGFGDVKLALGIGWLLGPTYGIFAVFIAFVIGAIVSVPLLLASSPWWKNMLVTHTRLSGRLAGGFTMGSEVPFGPFLVTSTIIIWFLLIFGHDPLAIIGLSPLSPF